MTRNQIRWASQHDWFIRANEPAVGQYDGGTVYVLEQECGPDNVWTERTLAFTDYRALRAWAGY